MKVALKKVSDLTLSEGNPRQNDKAVDAVVASIREFGFRQPLVVDERLVIIAGHTRYKAAVKMGLEKVPVHIASDLTPEQIKAYRIADNKTGEIADWDIDLLKIDLRYLTSEGVNVIPGFSEEELNEALKDALKPKIKKLEIKKLPELAWVLISIDASQYGLIAELVQKIGDMPGVDAQTTVTGARDEN